MPDEIIQQAAPAARDEKDLHPLETEKKQPPGNVSRRKAKEKKEYLLRTPSEYRADKGEWAKDFEACGKPNLAEPGTDLDYTRKLQLTVLYQMATTAFPTIAQQAAWKRIKEISAVIGMTSNRAQLESKVKRMSEQLATQTQIGTINEVSGKGFKKNPEARGGMTGPKLIEELPSEEA